MTRDEYLEIHSNYINLFDENWNEKTIQIDLTSELEKLKYKETDSFRENFAINSRTQSIINFISSIGSQINLYSINILKLEKWNQLFQAEEDFNNRKIFILQDRIIPFSTLLLLEPNVFRNRISFIYQTVLEERFELFDIDGRRDFHSLKKDKYVRRALKYDYDLSTAIKLINRINREETKKFRDQYTHKFPPNIAIGHFTEIIKLSHGGKSAIGFNSHSPMQVNKIIDLAEKEIKNIISAFNELSLFLNHIKNYT